MVLNLSIHGASKTVVGFPKMLLVPVSHCTVQIIVCSLIITGSSKNLFIYNIEINIFIWY